MKKRILALLLASLLLLPLCACGNRGSVGVIGGADGPTAVLVSGGRSLFRKGNVKHAVAQPVSSEIYSEDDIAGAIRTVKDYFHDGFSGCTLTEIAYAGDERTEQEAEYAERYGMEDIIVLVSAFDVDQHGGDGSLKPNGHYQGWLWILGRKAGGDWQHLDHGY